MMYEHYLLFLTPFMKCKRPKVTRYIDSASILLKFLFEETA